MNETIEELLIKHSQRIAELEKQKAELLSIVKQMIYLEDLIEYPDDTKAEHYEEAKTVHALLAEAKQAIKNAE